MPEAREPTIGSVDDIKNWLSGLDQMKSNDIERIVGEVRDKVNAIFAREQLKRDEFKRTSAQTYDRSSDPLQINKTVTDRKRIENVIDDILVPGTPEKIIEPTIKAFREVMKANPVPAPPVESVAPNPDPGNIATPVAPAPSVPPTPVLPSGEVEDEIETAELFDEADDAEPTPVHKPKVGFWKSIDNGFGYLNKGFAHAPLRWFRLGGDSSVFRLGGSKGSSSSGHH